MLNAREIDWAGATVDGGTLRVELIGDAPRGWQGRFKAVTRLLDQAVGRCGAVTISGAAITVKEVTEGVESDLQHFLEGVVQQVNADLGLEAEEHLEQSPLERRRAVDRDMAARFRSFAGARNDAPR